MADLNELRQKYPQYNDMNDQQFADAFHNKFYSDLPVNDFYNKIGYSPNKIQGPYEKQYAGDNLLKGIYKGLSEGGKNLGNLGGSLYNTLIASPANTLFGADIKAPQIQSPDYQKDIINYTPQQQQSIPGRTGEMIGEIAPAFALPAIGFEEAALNTAKSLPMAGDYLATLLKNPGFQKILPQSLYAAGTVPNERVTSGLEAGAVMAPLTAISQGIMSGNPLIRILSRTGLGLGVGALGYGGAKSVGANNWESVLTGAGLGTLAATHGIKTPSTLTKENVFNGVEGTPYAEKLEKAKNIGLDFLTPAEASESDIAGAYQGKSGVTPETSRLLKDRLKARESSENKAITNLYNDISPSTKNAPYEVRQAAQNELQSLDKQRKDISAPFYEKSEMQKIPPSWVVNLEKNDPNIKKAISNVMEDERFQKEGELLNVPKNTVKVLDYAKRDLDAQIRAAKSGDKPNRNLARVLTDSKNNLVDKIDSINQDYKKSRQVYAENSPPVENFKESELGRIADLNNTQLKNVSNQIFDPAQTDLNVLRNIKQTVQKQDPQAWNKIVRYHLEKMMGKKANVNGTTFYNTVLSNPQKFDQFSVALEDRPELVKKLEDMRDVFKDLSGPGKVKGAIKLSQTSISNERSSWDALKKFLKQKFGEKYDKQAVELMTSPNWQDELSKMILEKNKVSKSSKLMNALINTTAKGAAQKIAH